MKRRLGYRTAEVKYLIKETLKKYIGFPPLKTWQEGIVRSILSGKNTLILMPPSKDKYICLILPILISKGMGLIISHSEKLLKNLIQIMEKMGVPYIFIAKDKDLKDAKEIIEKINSGFFKFIVFKNIKILEKLKSFPSENIKYITLGIESVDFKNSILYIKDLINYSGKVPIVILISNPSPEIRENIIKTLNLKSVKVFVRGFYRPNLCHMVIKGENKQEKIIDIINKVSGQGLIFVDSKQNAYQIRDFLKEENISSEIYADDAENLRKIAGNFHKGKTKVLITNREFYNNIKKTDIRYVIHYSLPFSLTEYYFESGIAGLDGKKSYCILLYHPRDRYKCEEKIREKFPEEYSEERSLAFSMLEVLEDYIFSNACRKSYILSYFGDEEVKERCGICDVCVGYKRELMLKKYDINVIKIILKCITELREKFGINTVVDVLRGKMGKKIQQFNLNRASTFGMLKELDRKIIKENINSLILDRYISVRRGVYPTLELTHWGKNVIKEEEIFEIKLPKFINRKVDKPFDPVLFEQLRLVRRKVAKRLDLPTFQIFLDRVLQELATYLPETEEEMEKIKGVGKTKMELYGKKFIDAIKDYKKKKEMMEK